MIVKDGVEIIKLFDKFKNDKLITVGASAQFLGAPTAQDYADIRKFNRVVVEGAYYGGTPAGAPTTANKRINIAGVNDNSASDAELRGFLQPFGTAAYVMNGNDTVRYQGLKRINLANPQVADAVARYVLAELREHWDGVCLRGLNMLTDLNNQNTTAEAPAFNAGLNMLNMIVDNCPQGKQLTVEDWSLPNTVPGGPEIAASMGTLVKKWNAAGRPAAGITLGINIRKDKDQPIDQTNINRAVTAAGTECTFDLAHEIGGATNTTVADLIKTTSATAHAISRATGIKTNISLFPYTDPNLQVSDLPLNLKNAGLYARSDIKNTGRYPAKLPKDVPLVGKDYMNLAQTEKNQDKPAQTNSTGAGSDPDAEQTQGIALTESKPNLEVLMKACEVNPLIVHAVEKQGRSTAS